MFIHARRSNRPTITWATVFLSSLGRAPAPMQSRRGLVHALVAMIWEPASGFLICVMMLILWPWAVICKLYLTAYMFRPASLVAMCEYYSLRAYFHDNPYISFPHVGYNVELIRGERARAAFRIVWGIPDDGPWFEWKWLSLIWGLIASLPLSIHTFVCLFKKKTTTTEVLGPHLINVGRA